MVIEQKEEGLSVLLEGELGHHEALSALRSLEDAISQQSPSRMELDFSGVSFMDSSGIGVLIGRYKTIRERRGVMTLYGLKPAVAKIVEMAGLDQIMNVE